MRYAALEKIRFSGPEDANVCADRNFQFALYDESGLLAGVSQHGLAGVGAGRIGVFHHLQRVPSEIPADLANRMFPEPDFAQLLPRVENALLRRLLVAEKHGDGKLKRGGDLLKGRDRRAHLSALDLRDRGVAQPATASQIALGEPMRGSHCAQARRDIGVHVRPHLTAETIVVILLLAKRTVSDGAAHEFAMIRTRSMIPYLAGGVAVIIWGATPAATAIVGRDIAPGLIGVARLMACAVVLIPLTLIFRPRLPNDPGGRAALLMSGAVGFFGSFMLQGLGIPRTSTSHAALILTLPPVFTALVQFVLSRRWPRPLWWIGSAIALSGVATLIFGRNKPGGGAPTLLGDAIVLAGAVTVSIGYVAGARLSARIGLFAATTWSLLLGAAIALPAVPWLLDEVNQVTWVGWAALMFLAVLCTLVGFAAWFWALDKGGVASIAPLQFGQPVVSLIIAVTLLSESLSATIVLALCLISCGVYLSRRAL